MTIKDIFKENIAKIISGILIVILSVMIFLFYEKTAGILFFLLAVFVLITFIFDVNWQERMFAGLLAFSIFLFDVLQNKLATDINFMVHISAQEVRAMPLFWISYFIAFAILAFLMFRAVTNDVGNKVRDFIFGVVGLLGLGFMMTGAMLTFYFPPKTLIPFFAFEITIITFYHFLGIFLVIVATMYYIITK